jgi:hypothetical protein
MPGHRPQRIDGGGDRAGSLDRPEHRDELARLAAGIQ